MTTQEDLATNLSGKKIKKINESQKNSEISETNAGEELMFKGTFMSEIRSDNRRKDQSSLAKQNKNAMMSSISPREEQSNSTAKKF